MTNESRISKPEPMRPNRRAIHWNFGFRNSFVIRHGRFREAPTRDSSRATVYWNGPIRVEIGRAVSPHPNPLPQGEGIASIAEWKRGISGLIFALRRIHPLPEGEGRGEGKHGTAHENVLEVHARTSVTTSP